MRFVKFNPNRFTPDPKKIIIPKVPKKLVKKIKPTGELEVFKLIWDKRSHFCEHCGVPIREFSHENFDHILTKKQRPDLRLVQKNIRLICFDCHFSRHNQTIEQFNKRKEIVPKFLGKLQ